MSDQPQLLSPTNKPPELLPITTKLLIKNLLFQPLQELIVHTRLLEIIQLVPHGSQTLNNTLVVGITQTMLNLIFDNGTHLLGSIKDDIGIVSANEQLFELRNGVFGRDLGSFRLLVKEGVDVQAGKRLFCLAVAFSAFDLWWDWDSLVFVLYNGL